MLLPPFILLVLCQQSKQIKQNELILQRLKVAQVGKQLASTQYNIHMNTHTLFPTPTPTYTHILTHIHTHTHANKDHL